MTLYYNLMFKLLIFCNILQCGILSNIHSFDCRFCQALILLLVMCDISSNAETLACRNLMFKFFCNIIECGIL